MRNGFLWCSSIGKQGEDSTDGVTDRAGIFYAPDKADPDTAVNSDAGCMARRGEERLIASPRLSRCVFRQCVLSGIKTTDPHVTWARHRPECRSACRRAHAGILVDRARALRASGSRPGGWVGRGPAWTGRMGLVIASSTGRRISSP